MSDRIEVRYQTCKCSHDRASHYREYRAVADPGEDAMPFMACLALNCENCVKYELAKELK
jgi:hypothetical protein